MQQLVTQSIAIIEAGQTVSGAYVASPFYPNYHFCWFRDGTFIAHAMDTWHRQASAERFYDWAAQVILARSEAIQRCLVAVAEGRFPVATDLLDTRYTPDGQAGDDEEWPNFQLDGFGTLLWGLHRHLVLTDQTALPPPWQAAARLLVRYLAALWDHPNADCWEEFPDRIATSTLAALYAGLHAITSALGENDPEGNIASMTATRIKAFVLEHGVRDGHLIKQTDGDDAVDASLLWCSVPFGEHGLFTPMEPVMRATVARIETDLVGATGGVHRYRTDTFYGGGEWPLLTALLGEYRAAIGEREGAFRCLAIVEAHADSHGYLPEQSSTTALSPAYIAQWQARWGPVANPLLWSHAAYLSLYAVLNNA